MLEFDIHTFLRKSGEGEKRGRGIATWKSSEKKNWGGNFIGEEKGNSPAGVKARSPTKAARPLHHKTKRKVHELARSMSQWGRDHTEKSIMRTSTTRQASPSCQTLDTGIGNRPLIGFTTGSHRARIFIRKYVSAIMPR